MEQARLRLSYGENPAQNVAASLNGLATDFAESSSSCKNADPEQAKSALRSFLGQSTDPGCRER